MTRYVYNTAEPFYSANLNEEQQMQREQGKRFSGWGVLYSVLTVVSAYNAYQSQTGVPFNIITWLPPVIFMVLSVREFVPMWRRPLTIIAWLLIAFVLIYLLYDAVR